MSNLPIRKPNRLFNYDYARNGAYFVTVCVYKHQNFLGRVIVNDNDNIVCGRSFDGARLIDGEYSAKIKLTPLGECVDETIKNVNNNNNVKIDKYVIMPNHIHLIVVICDKTGDRNFGGNAGDRGRSPLQYIVRNIKSYVSKYAGFAVWQKSFHDHIIRDENDYRRIAEYIETNPQKWFNDCFYNEMPVGATALGRPQSNTPTNKKE